MSKMKSYDKIGELVKACLLAEWDTADIVAEVQRQFDNARTDEKSVHWYRCQLRKEGALPKLHRKKAGAKKAGAKKAELAAAAETQTQA